MSDLRKVNASAACAGVGDAGAARTPARPMGEQVYIVTNTEGLKVRSKPDTNTGTTIRVMTNGEVFRAADVFFQGLRTWARLTSGAGSMQEYACIGIGDRKFAVLSGIEPEPLPATEGGWATGLDAWARSMGYRGPKP